MELIQISALQDLLSHFRFHLTLRSEEGHYHSLILFRLASGKETEPSLSDKAHDASKPEQGASIEDRQIYVMEASCPHLGADMSHAEIEECDMGVIAVCPWHRYDFNLKTGKSETGLTTCTYAVEVKTDPKDGLEKVYMEYPKGGRNWRLIELRPVSEEFADPPSPIPIQYLPEGIESGEPREDEPVIPMTRAPTTLMQWAVLILNTPDPMLKVERTRHAAHMFFTGKLALVGNKSPSAPQPPHTPPRDASFSRNTVDVSKIRSRKNRAVMLHALANIEQWAIDLAWDIIARFGPVHHNLPPAFFFDFTKMALDESKHFSLLTSRLAAISPSTPYGSMPVHASLWESATITSHSLRSRLAIIHLVHEARGLDVNPATIERFKKAGDMDTVAVMEVIHADEVTHVTSGHRWFTWICAQEGDVDPVDAFRAEVKKGWRGDIKGPFNVEDREKAGLTREFYEGLKGEMGFPTTEQRIGETQKSGAVEQLATRVSALQVGYEH
ncbi:hypothetical protein HYPSUDRAFT_193892 [Hypholoma sublateritium FD-334 SS-4]|uniref:Rieske domain-containing protein n=1 Tax=Hypholoma sublateritium (strain FD-334 SS-4) TaxID=945553 RepID=A0A0D2N9W6_HYPSF|nr:hypothetical protein HYPSUDRAFT_193892 [Hypholoma sublateritium FD-334 SS-4]